MSISDEADFERTLVQLPQVYVFKIPPRTSEGHRASNWPTQSTWGGKVKIVAKGNLAVIHLVSEQNQLFASCPVRDDTYVERTIDSGRYFALKIENNQGKHAYIGIAFNDRNHAFDFNVALDEHKNQLLREEQAKKAFADLQSNYAGQDLHLGAGEKIKINFGKSSSSSSSSAVKKPSGGGSGGGGMLLAPPGSASKSGLLSPPPNSSIAPNNNNNNNNNLDVFSFSSPSPAPSSSSSGFSDPFASSSTSTSFSTSSSNPFGSSSDPFGSSFPSSSDPFATSSAPSSTVNPASSFDPFGFPSSTSSSSSSSSSNSSSSSSDPFGASSMSWSTSTSTGGSGNSNSNGNLLDF